MKKDITIAAEPRDKRGKNEARRLRVKGLTPGVLYGAEKESVAVAVSPKEVRRILHSSTGHNTIFTLAIQGAESTPAMVVDWQTDPIKDNLLHVDMKRIDLSKRIAVKVPVQTQGDPKGVKLQGGLLEIITREVEIECLPEDIPEQFTLNLSDLAVGQAVRGADVPLSGSMKLLSSPEIVIAHVISLKAEVAAEGTAASTAEPEVIKKGKKEEEGKAPATKTAATKTAAPTKAAAKPAATKKK